MNQPTALPAPPDVVRSAYVELVVSDLAKAREFYVDLLGLVVTEQTDQALYLRTFEEFIHHNLVLRQGPEPAAAVIGYRVRTPADVDAAERYFTALGCPTRRLPGGFVDGIGDAVRVQDPLGFPCEFFYDTEHRERMTWRYETFGAAPLARMDHVNVVVPDVDAGARYLRGLGFKLTEDIRDGDGVTYAAWLGRKSTVHDTALTGGAGPRLHHMAFATHESHHVLALCDRIGALRLPQLIERGPGRHGVSNAFYLYLRDFDGHRIEIYTHDYYTGDPDNPTVSWDVHDDQRRDWWGNPVVPSWYEQASPVLDLDGAIVPVVQRAEPSEAAAGLLVGADGFTADLSRAPESAETKLGNQV